LQGSLSNRLGMGARVRVTVERPDGTLREIHRVVDSGGSFGGNSLQTEIGLGDATMIRELEIRWPSDNSVQRFTNVDSDAAYEVREDDPELRPLALRAFDWPTGLAPSRSMDHDPPGNGS
jgi:hypothetical protein